MKFPSVAAIAVVLSASSLWAVNAASVTAATPPPAAQPAPAAPQMATVDQRRISELERQVVEMKGQLDQLKGRVATNEGKLTGLAVHTHTYEQENLGGTNLATIQAHPNDITIATKPTAQNGGPKVRTSSGPKAPGGGAIQQSSLPTY